MVKKSLISANTRHQSSPLPRILQPPLLYKIKIVKYNKTQFYNFLNDILHWFPPSPLSPCCCRHRVAVIKSVPETAHGIIPFLLFNLFQHRYGILRPIHLPHPCMLIPTGRVPQVQLGQGKFMEGFVIRQGREFPLVQYSEKYLLFLNNSNPNPNIVIVIMAHPGTGPASSPLPTRPPLRPH